jgi:hypothetical protein
MQAVRVEHYLRRANDFLDGMRLTNLDDSFLASSALLAIHSAVSYSDALRTGLGDTDLASDDHKRALDGLQRLLPKRIEDRSGLTQLQELLKNKSTVAYGSRRLTEAELKGMANRAERFARWANAVGHALKIEGWRYDEE